MAKKDVVKYRCMNFGVCAKADANEVIEIPAIDTLGGIPLALAVSRIPCRNFLQVVLNGL